MGKEKIVQVLKEKAIIQAGLTRKLNAFAKLIDPGQTVPTMIVSIDK